jgi:progressive ankylosis protein
VVALLGKKNEKYIPLRDFAWFLGIVLVGSLAVIAFTPMAAVWFHHVAGLSLELAQFSYLPTRVMAILPGLTLLISLQRGILVNTKHTSPITWATIIEVGVIIGVLYISITHLDVVGAVAAAYAFTLGRLAANLYLFPHQFKAVAG